MISIEGNPTRETTQKDPSRGSSRISNIARVFENNLDTATPQQEHPPTELPRKSSSSAAKHQQPPPMQRREPKPGQGNQKAGNDKRPRQSSFRQQQSSLNDGQWDFIKDSYREPKDCLKQLTKLNMDAKSNWGSHLEEGVSSEPPARPPKRYFGASVNLSRQAAQAITSGATPAGDSPNHRPRPTSGALLPPNHPAKLKRGPTLGELLGRDPTRSSGQSDLNPLISSSGDPQTRPKVPKAKEKFAARNHESPSSRVAANTSEGLNALSEPQVHKNNLLSKEQNQDQRKKFQGNRQQQQQQQQQNNKRRTGSSTGNQQPYERPNVGNSEREWANVSSGDHERQNLIRISDRRKEWPVPPRCGRGDHTYDLDVVAASGGAVVRRNSRRQAPAVPSSSTDPTGGNVTSRNVKDGPDQANGISEAYPDHPERDSLDGNLPGSSQGTGNPPPPPAPPTPLQGSSFAKGPHAARNKKHKKFKNESEDSPAHSGGAGLSSSSSSSGGGGGGGEGGGGGISSSLGGGKEEVPEKETRKEKSHKEIENSSGGYRSRMEPFTYLWVVMSGMYGKLVVLLMLAFCLTEVLDNKVAPLTFQGIYLMYLYVGSIVAIMCIYVSVIIDNCPSITASKENLTKTSDPEIGSITSFGTLKRAHISRSKTSRTSFYLRVGALVFGLGTLIFNGLEIAMHATMNGECVEDIIFAHPILQALFTFLQMHFLFVNSEVIVEKFGQVARFGFMHLVATNVALWVRMVVWEAANDWIDTKYDKELPPASPTTSLTAVDQVPPHASQVLRLYSCFRNNTLGRLWISAQPYLFPFLVQYSLIAAAVTYIMWCNVGKEKLTKLAQVGKKAPDESATLDKRTRKGHWKVDCRSASKGLFLGLLCLVGGIVVLIIFFVMKDQEDFKVEMFWIRLGTQMIILSLSIITSVIGFLQVPKLSVSTSKPLDLDRLLLSTTILGVYLFAVFGMIVGGINYTTSESLATFCVHALLLLQVSLQDMLVAETSRRTCTTRYQMLTKPGRQVVTFLLFANVTLWILETFMTHTNIAQQFQLDFYGVLAWGIVSRISLPLMILYRFHSAVILVEIWKNTYRTKAD
ncbi:uncharacterized protein LOC143028294 [Oratosquilla oratoria]|uniref:uncharacterized protein LOC143028294 n=1 Tax=Oratosquilla oratoria TaxID=337810 RepID=UPI003F772E45